MIRIFSDYKRLIVLLLSIGSLYFWSSCAAVKQASGGPKDTTPPELILANPSSGSIHFSGNQIELLFNEYIDENSLATAIQFFPQLKEAPEIQYKGKKTDYSYSRFFKSKANLRSFSQSKFKR